MREAGGITVPALLALGGIDVRLWMRARWPDDVALLEALAVECNAIDRRRREEQAVMIANKVGEMIDKSS